MYYLWSRLELNLKLGSKTQSVTRRILDALKVQEKNHWRLKSGECKKLNISNDKPVH